MRRAIFLYTTFTLAMVAVIAVFITATTLVQLAVGIVVYPLLIYFAYKIVPKGLWRYTRKHPMKVHLPEAQEKQEEVIAEDKKDVRTTEISDINKRAFLKIVGATGISFLLISIFGQRIQSMLFGGGQAFTGNQPPGGVPTGKTNGPLPSPTDEYNISEISEGALSYYGFINQSGGWFIMRGDTGSGTFRYIRGASNFPGNWKNREFLKYEYFNDVFNQKA